MSGSFSKELMRRRVGGVAECVFRAIAIADSAAS
jgi:hypothetical protein